MWTDARSGIARSNATRSGYPVLQGAKVPLYALSNIARSGATRSNYTSSRPFIAVGGIHFGFGRLGDAGILDTSLTIQDALNETPSTCTFTTRGFVPREGADIVITLGSKHSLDRVFAGTVMSTRSYYVGDKPVAENMLHEVSCIDYTWGLGRLKVSGRFVNTTVGAIAATLLPLVPDYTLYVDAEIAGEVIDEITFTELDVPSALRQLVKRVGGEWYCDYNRVIRLFYEDTSGSPPTILNTVHPSLADFSSTRDLSQVVTRVYVEGGGVDALETISPGETIVPVETTAWYLPTGGVVLAGAQRIRYGGITVGGGGSLVGTGASPSTSLNASLSPGPGVNIGPHEYAVTYRTAAGESIAGPRTTIQVGAFAAPSAAPVVVAGTLQPGVGPDPGVHDYAVTFLAVSGETTPGPRLTQATAETPAPLTGPNPDQANPGTGPDTGVHDYAVTFGTAIGETAASPIGGQIVTGPIAPPTSAPVLASTTVGTGPEPGAHDYAITFGNSAGETPPGPRVVKVINEVTPNPTTAPTPGSPRPGPGPPQATYNYLITFQSAGGETQQGPGVDVTNTASSTPTPTVAATAGPEPNYNVNGQGYFNVGDSVQVALSYVTASGETTIGPLSNTATIADIRAYGWPGSSMPTCLLVTNLPISSDPAVTQKRIYTKRNGFWTWRTTVPANATWCDVPGSQGPTDSISVPPEVNTAVGTVVPLTLPLGSAGIVTGRKLYRRMNNGGTWNLVQTVPNNVTTAFGITVPSSGVTVALAGQGSGNVDNGVHSYRVTFATAEGETPGSTAVASVTVTDQTTNGRVEVTGIPLAAGSAGVTARKLYRTGARWPVAPTYLQRLDGPTLVGLYDWAVTFVSAAGETAPSVRLTVTVPSSSWVQIGIPIGPAGVTSRKLYRTVTGAGTGSALKLVGVINDNTSPGFTDNVPDWSLGATASTDALKLMGTVSDNVTTSYLDNVADASLGAVLPTVNTTGDHLTQASLGAEVPAINTAYWRQVSLSNIQIGPGGTGQRHIYRTAIGNATLRLVGTLSNNTTTTYVDTKADAALGDPAPSGNTAVVNAVHLGDIARGTGAFADDVLSRKLYRRSAGAGLRYLATIPNNTATTYTDTIPNSALGAPPPAVSTAYLQVIPLTKIPLGGPLTIGRKVYRSRAGLTQLKLLATLNDNVTTDYLDVLPDASLGADAPTVNTATAAQVQLSAIPVGAATVLERRIYRTAAYATQLQLLQVLLDNVTTTWLDAAADAALGANVPTEDLSLLTQPQGNVLAGSTSLQVAGVSKFSPLGGWAVAGSQIVRYTGISGNNLAGIPPLGPGSITATISYNATVYAAPLLIDIPASGPGSIRHPILKGDAVNLFVQEDDLFAQQSVIAQLGGGDGIIEDELQDRRLSETEARARAKARLALLAARDDQNRVGVVTVSYRCRDLNSRTGRMVTVNLGPPIDVRGDFLIQRVSISTFYLPHVNPTYTVEASSLRFSYDELLRLIRKAGS